MACSGAGPDVLAAARGHLAAGRYTKAAETYRVILSEAPATPAAHEGLVRSLLASRKAAEADEAAGWMGLDFLSGLRLTLNYREGCLRFDRSGR